MTAIVTLDPYLDSYMFEKILDGSLATNVPQQINFSSEYYEDNFFQYDPNYFYLDTVREQLALNSSSTKEYTVAIKFMHGE